MTDSPETARVLTLDTGQRWSGALQKHFRLREVDYKQARDVDDAVELLNSGDFTALITDGLKGQWRMMVDEADKLEVRPIVLSNSTMTVDKARSQGVSAFHARRSLTNGGMDEIIRVATRPKEAEQTGL